ATPKLRVADTTVAENDPAGHARFLVTLSAPSAGTVTVKASTAAGTATSGTDFTAVTNQTVTFLPGELLEVVTVDVTDDNTTEPDETFTLNLSAPTGATVARAQGTATILDDDGIPAISIDDASVIEGNSGTASAAFTVSLSHPSSTAVTVRADTANGTAHQPGDFTAVTNQTVTIPAGSTSA